MCLLKRALFACILFCSFLFIPKNSLAASVDDLFSTMMASVESASYDSAYLNYQERIKYFLTIGLGRGVPGVGGVDVIMYVDFADYMGVTPESQDDWVTVYL